MTRRVRCLVCGAVLVTLAYAGGCVSVDMASLLSPKLKEAVIVESRGWTSDRVLVVDISGMITGERAGMLGASDACTPEKVKAVLDRAEADKRVKAVVLRIDSPGGTVSESDSIHHEVQTFRKRTNKPVLAEIMGLGCSGAYYVASAADRIYAHPSALTGSIGVVGYFHRLEKLADKIGYGQVVIKSGKMKDMGNPFREMPEDERVVMQDVIMAYYDQFLAAVVAGRPGYTSRDQLVPVADGRVYTAGQAVEKKLVDQIAYLDAVIADAMKAAGIDDAKVVTYTRAGVEDANIYTQPVAAPAFSLTGLNVNLPSLVGGMHSGFYYLWLPGIE